jgi:L-ascorbate metabolism protein UlaG (beta-lactamase superfamily)
MMRSRNSKILFGVAIGAIVILTPIILMISLGQEPSNEINVTLLFNAGVMIEAKGIRIFIDPLYMENYTDLHADAILVTHPHFDHYRADDVEDLMSDDTLFVCPNNMTDAIDRFDGYGVDPGDSFLVGDINITAFRMYMPDYPQGPTFHPKSANWTSYVIDIDGFTIYHAGDGKYMAELEDLADTIDVAFLPIYYDFGYGPLNESLIPIVDVINLLEPRTTIPMHYIDLYRETFFTEYSILVENPACEILNLDYHTTVTFTSDET